MLNYFGNLQCINTVLNVISQTLAHTSLASLNPSLERDLVNSALSLMRLVTSAIFRTPLKIINKNYLHLYIFNVKHCILQSIQITTTGKNCRNLQFVMAVLQKTQRDPGALEDWIICLFGKIKDRIQILDLRFF